MNKTVTDVIVHTNTLLADSAFTQLCDHVYLNAGIISVSRNAHTPKFLMVVYDSAVIRSRRVLDLVVGFGCQAKLVGI